jgi:hypothetical protein
MIHDQESRQGKMDKLRQYPVEPKTGLCSQQDSGRGKLRITVVSPHHQQIIQMQIAEILGVVQFIERIDGHQLAFEMFTKQHIILQIPLKVDPQAHLS